MVESLGTLASHELRAAEASLEQLSGMELGTV